LVVAKVMDRLAVSKRPANKVDKDKFFLMTLNEGEVKEQYQVTIKNRFSALERIMRTLIGYGMLLYRTSKFLPKRVLVIVKQSITNHVLMRNVQNWLIEGSKLNYSGCRTQVY
jgi:hypothetical protein